jgi:hypothetical protein
MTKEQPKANCAAGAIRDVFARRSAVGAKSTYGSTARSEFNLLCEPGRIVHFYAKIANSRLDLRVSEQKWETNI